MGPREALAATRPLGPWAVYFLGLAWLQLRGVLQVPPAAALLLALALMIPLPHALAARRGWRAARRAAALLAAAALVWHASWVPSPARAWALFASTGHGFSPAYFVRLGLGVLAPLDWAVLAAIVAACLWLGRRIALAPLAFAAIVGIAIAGGGRSETVLEPELERFFAAEAQRAVAFPERPAGPDLDVVLVHVCSMSWDDLRESGLARHPFLGKLDVLFTGFNSVSSYTNPSAIRLLRAPCGQTRHEELARVTRPECYLLDVLRRAGYRTWSAIDNDAPSYRFVEDIMAQGHADLPMTLAGLPVWQLDFDDTPINDDAALLARWLDARARAPERRAALYVDLTTMHGGSHRKGDGRWWARTRADLYREAGERLFANLDAFLEALRASGRRTLVIVVGEHGVALRGSAFQPPDLREIPFPSITLVPAGVKLVDPGLPAAPARQALVTGPASYLALAHLVAQALEARDARPEALFSDVELARLPSTPLVAENEAAMVVRAGGDVLWRNARTGAFRIVAPAPLERAAANGP